MSSEPESTPSRRAVVLRWAARLLSLGPILFALGEVLSPHSQPGVPVPWQDLVLVGIMFTGVLGLALAWRWERLGAWVTIGAYLVFLGGYALVRGEFFPIPALFTLSLILVPAVLFLLSASARRIRGETAGAAARGK